MTERRLAALVIGAGIAGIQAALDIADAGFHVHLVERAPTIGGRMAQLDKTFPTLDCSSCILTPKMSAVARHSNVDLQTLSEVVSVEPSTAGRREVGGAGEIAPSFRVRVKRKPRYVKASACTGCGLCADACRMKGRVSSEFDEGIARRSAIYVPFPQAVPLAYTIDESTCLNLTRGSCGTSFACADACDAGAIDFAESETFADLEVNAIVVATGFDLIDPRVKPEFGYGQYPEVMTGMEFERLVSASGPTTGKLLVNGREPRDVVFIKCVGSRTLNPASPTAPACAACTRPSTPTWCEMRSPMPKSLYSTWMYGHSGKATRSSTTE